jgi:putative flippase GtrA
VRSRLRFFFVVGLLATAVDIGIVLWLATPGQGALRLALTDVAALTCAAIVAYLLNRNVTFRGDRSARWVRRPSLFAATATLAAVVDIAVLLFLAWLGVPLLVAKSAAVLAAAVLRWISYRRILLNEVRRELGERSRRPPAPGDLRLSVVIPAFEERELITDTIRAIDGELATQLERGSYELLVVDDGSSDDTSARASAAGAHVVRLDENRGKGGAVKAGVLAARGQTIVFTDADLAYPAALLLDVLAKVEAGWDVVVGSRRHHDTNTLVKAGRLRVLGGRVINLLTHVVLLGNFRDTQCGLKGFRSDVGKVIFERTMITGFAFDVEIFLIAEQDRLSLTEIPVSITNRSGSSVQVIGDTVDLLRALFRIRRWAGAGRYVPTAEQAAIIQARTVDC